MPTLSPALLDTLHLAAINAGIFVAAIVIALVTHWIVMAVLGRMSRHALFKFGQALVQHASRSSRAVFVAVALWCALGLSTLPPNIEGYFLHVVAVLLIITATWLVATLLHVARDWVLHRYSISQPDNLHARAVHTQIKVLEQMLTALIIAIGIGCVLMTFDRVRQLGVSLLASAGIAGVILGLAAQKVLGTLLAGLQVAITQPIRLGDVVIVENEWGVIEEITLTYVVVRIWDLRRLVVPMTYFLEKPFQNWTRTSADLLGTVFFYLDATADLASIREEFKRLVAGSPKWDKKVCVLQVTDLTDRTMQVRCLVSTANAGDGFDLRCLVREQLLSYIKDTQPGALPRLRITEEPAKEGSPEEPTAAPSRLPAGAPVAAGNGR